MAKTKVKIELEAQTREASKNIAELEKHLISMQSQFKNMQIGSQDFRDFGKEIEIVRNKIDRASKSMAGTGERAMGLAMQIGAVGASAAAMIEHYKAVIQKSREFEQANMKLEAAAKLTGVALSQLRSVSEKAQQQHGLNVKQANEFTISLSKLTTKAGESGKITQVFGAFLDLAAAQGLNAEQALEALNQTLMGQDEGLDKLVQKNPSAIYEEFAKQIGVSAGKMSEAQKAQAIVNEFLTQGAKVQGQYAANLNTTAGKQQAFNNAMEVFAAKVGKEADKVLGDILNLLVPLANAISKMDSAVLAGATAFATFTAAIYSAGAALTALGVIANTTPIGWIATAAGLAAGAISYLYAETTKLTPEMEKAQQLASKSGDAFQKEYEALKKTNPEVAELARATKDLADAEERLKKIREGKAIGSEAQVKSEIQNAKTRITQNEKQLEKLDEQRKRINEVQAKIDKAQAIVNKNESARQQGKLVVGEENARQLLAKLNAEIEREKAMLNAMMGGDKSRGDDLTMQNERRSQIFKTQVEQRMINPLLEVKKQIDALNNEKLDPKTDATRLRQINDELDKLQFKIDVLNGKINRPPKPSSNPPIDVAPMRPDFPVFENTSMLNLPNVDQGQFNAISQRMAYRRYQSGMMRRIGNAGQERNLGDLQMFRQINEARATQARERGDTREFEDAQSAIERIGEISEEINNTLSNGAQRYVDILGGGMSQVANAFGDQVAAGIFGESFSIGQVFENIAKQFISQIVSEFINQEIFSLFTSLIPEGGILGGLFADGGRPSVGRVSVVGERGAEFFKPDVPGRVVSSKEASSQVAAMLDLFERPSAQVDMSELSRLIAVQTEETVRLRGTLARKEFAVDIDGEKANSRLRRVERRVETRLY